MEFTAACLANVLPSYFAKVHNCPTTSLWCVVDEGFGFVVARLIAPGTETGNELPNYEPLVRCGRGFWVCSGAIHRAGGGQ